jgi:hypothetical protein
MFGKKRQDTFGAMPVRGSSSAVECCLPLVPAHAAGPGRCSSLMHAGGKFVRLGYIAERLRAGDRHLRSGSVRLGRVAPG